MEGPPCRDHGGIGTPEQEEGAAPRHLEEGNKVLGKGRPHPVPESEAVDLVDEVELVAEPEQLHELAMIENVGGECCDSGHQEDPGFAPARGQGR